MSEPERINLPPGPPQRFYRIGVLWWYLYALVTAIASFVLVVSNAEPIPIASPILFGLFWLGLAGALTFVILAKSKEAREAAAGYTTGTRIRRDLTQVDNRTGVVIRRAGEPFLSPDEMRAAYRKARAKAEP